MLCIPFYDTRTFGVLVIQQLIFQAHYLSTDRLRGTGTYKYFLSSIITCFMFPFISSLPIWNGFLFFFKLYFSLYSTPFSLTWLPSLPQSNIFAIFKYITLISRWRSITISH